MSNAGFKNACLKHAIAYLSWLCVLVSTMLPAPGNADLWLSSNDELETRKKVAYVVAGLTVIGLAVGIACLANASGHHKHHGHHHGMSSVDNYRPYSDSSYSCSYSDYSHDYSSDSSEHSRHHHHHHHHSGYYSSNPYSNFSRNDVTSFSGSSNSNRRDSLSIRGKTLKSSNQAEGALSGHFIAHSSPSHDSSESLTAFVQLPDGTTQSLGSFHLSGNNSLPYGPFEQKGVYTFGVTLDSGNKSSSQLKLGSIHIEKNGSTVQHQDFTAPPHAPAGYEPAPCCFEL